MLKIKLDFWRRFNAKCWLLKRKLQSWLLFSIFELVFMTIWYYVERKERVLNLKVHIYIVNIKFKMKTWMLKIKLDFWRIFNGKCRLLKRKLQSWILFSIFELVLMTICYDVERIERVLNLNVHIYIVNIMFKMKTWMLKIKLDFWRSVDSWRENFNLESCLASLNL